MHSFQDYLGNHHGDKQDGNKCPNKDSFKTIHQKSGKSVLSRPSTKCAKMDPNLVCPRPLSLKTCIKRVLSRPLRMDLKKTLLSFLSLYVKRVKNLNPRYMAPVYEVSQVISDPKSRKKAQPVTEQPSSGPPPPGS